MSPVRRDVPSDLLPDDSCPPSAHRPICDCRLVTFLMDGAVLVSLALLAYLLKFTDFFPVLMREFKCPAPGLPDMRSPSVRFSLEGENLTKIPVLSHVDHFYQVTFGASLFLIVMLELLVVAMVQVPPAAAAPSYSPSALLSVCLIRSLRFVSGFIAGYFLVCIATCCLQKATGVFKPYFGALCPAPCLNYSATLESASTDELFLCFGLNSTKASRATYRDVLWKLKEGRLSFPSFFVSLASYCAIFLSIYLNNPVFRSHLNWTRSVRLVTTAAMLLGVFLLSNAEVIRGQSHLQDVLFACGLGSLVAAHVTLVHLKLLGQLDTPTYAGDTPPSPLSPVPSWSAGSICNNDVSSERKFPNYFEIPRVIYRGSQRWSRRGWRGVIGGVNPPPPHPRQQHESECRLGTCVAPHH